MNEIKKSCSNCKFAYYKKDTSRHPTIGVLRQHCASKDYNSSAYTEEMYREDFSSGFCRFWSPAEERKEVSENE